MICDLNIHARSFITSITATMSSLRKARDDSSKVQMTLFRFFNQRTMALKYSRAGKQRIALLISNPTSAVTLQ